jgi:hypothetical protein
MKELSGYELRNTLIENRLIDMNGKVSDFAIINISYLHTRPLLNEVWDIYQNDIVSMEQLRNFLNEIYKKGQFETLINIIKVFYSLSGLLIPELVQMVLNCEEKELKKKYLFKFLEDFKIIMKDFKADAKLFLDYGSPFDI